MKINVSIECETLNEFEWLAARLQRESTAAAVNVPAMQVTALELPNGEAAPADTPPKGRGRPKKEAKATPAPAPAPATEHPAAASVPGVPGALPELKQLKDTITTAARKAMKKEGPTTILDLLPAFRDATGLDFVMNATEDHRMALYELAVAAGIVEEMPL
jgi:hypothetical protein